MTCHVVTGRDYDFYAFRGRADVLRCVVCGELVDKWNEDRLRFDLPRRITFDISATYDGLLVVSNRFAAAVSAHGLKGLGLHPLERGMFGLLARRRVAFDAAARQTRFGKQCLACGQYQHVTGATPAFLKGGACVADDEFVWTDLEFGSGDEKHPLLICGEGAARVLRGARLRGLEPLKEVRESPDRAETPCFGGTPGEPPNGVREI